MKKKPILTRQQLEEIQRMVGEYTGEEKVQVSIHKTENVSIPASVFIFQQFASLCAINMNGSTSRVLLFLLSIQGYENIVGVDLATISETINMSRQTVFRCMKHLERFNIINKFPNPTDRRRNDYFINPMATWKGKSTQRLKQIEYLQRHQLQLELFNGEIKDDSDLNKSRRGLKSKRLLPMASK